MGHCHGLEVTSPLFGFNPEFPCSITACDSRKLSKKLGAHSLKLTLDTVREERLIRSYAAELTS